jgi:hypothetical protein
VLCATLLNFLQVRLLLQFGANRAAVNVVDLSPDTRPQVQELLDSSSRVYPSDIWNSSEARSSSGPARAAVSSECDNPEEDAKQQVRNPARCSMHLHPGCTVFHSKLFPQLIQAGPAAARASHSAGNSFAGRWPKPTSLPQVRCVALPILLHLFVAHRPGSLSSCATVGTFSSIYHSA